eukprot:13883615-Alexandrium_andersonii.AAC.1
MGRLDCGHTWVLSWQARSLAALLACSGDEHELAQAVARLIGDGQSGHSLDAGARFALRWWPNSFALSVAPSQHCR